MDTKYSNSERETFRILMRTDFAAEIRIITPGFDSLCSAWIFNYTYIRFSSRNHVCAFQMECFYVSTAWFKKNIFYI